MIRRLLLAACLMLVAAGGAYWAFLYEMHAQSQAVCTVPHILQNGTIADANQVMDNFNTLSACIANASGGAVSPGPFRLPIDVDDTNSIIAALATCRAVELQANVIYQISKPLPLCPGGNQHIFGHNGTIIQLASSYDVTQHTPCSAASDSATWRAIFYNVNCGGSAHTFTDTGISFNNFTIDGSAVTGPMGQTIAIFLRNVQYATVDKITCRGFADCTAILASQYTAVMNSIAQASINAGFDFWDSPLDALVEFSTVLCTGITAGQFGFLFNAADTTVTHDGIGANYTSVGNKSVGCGNALYIDPLTAGGSITGVIIADFLADGTYGVSGGKNGLAIWGNTMGAQISNIIVQNLVNGYAFSAAVSNGNYPSSINVQGLKIIKATDLNISQGMVIANEGNTGLGTDRIAGVSFGPASYYATPQFQYAIEADTTGQVIEGQFPTNGSVGLAKLGSGVATVINLNYAQVTLGACGSSPSMSGISARGSLTVGSGATLQCTVLFPTLQVFAEAPICTVQPSNSTPYAGVANVTATIAGFNIFGSSDMQGKAFLWQCNPL